MEKERKQMSVLEMEDRLYKIAHKLGFLRDAVLPLTDKEHHNSLTYEGAEGMGAVLHDLHGELEEIADAEIVPSASGANTITIPVAEYERLLKAGLAAQGVATLPGDNANIELVPKANWEQIRENLFTLQHQLRVVSEAADQYKSGISEHDRDAALLLIDISYGVFPTLLDVVHNSLKLSDFVPDDFVPKETEGASDGN